MRIINGDCLQEMDKLIEEGIIVDAVICDPPYQVSSNKWDILIPFDEMWKRLDKIVKPNGAIVIFGIEPFASALRMSNIKYYKYDWYWDKVLPAGHLNAKKQPMRSIETVSVFYKKQCIYNPQMRDREKPRLSRNSGSHNCYGEAKVDFSGEVLDKKYPINLVKFSKADMTKNNFHPTQKPTEFLRYLIRTYTNEGDVVLDFCAGSGSTGVAAKLENRDFILIEKEKKYFDISLERIDKTEV